jgi:hypothetical protein
MTGPHPFKTYQYDENRSHEPEHVEAHFRNIWKLPGALDYMIACNLQLRADLRWLLAHFGGRKGHARLAILAHAQGMHTRRLQKDRKTKKYGVGVGAAGHLKNAIAWYRKRFSHVIAADLLDKLEPFFVKGWNDAGAKPDKLAALFADVMQRTPKVDKRGRRPLKLNTASEYGSDRVAMTRLRKLLARLSHLTESVCRV